MYNEKQAAYWNEIAGQKWIKIGDAMEARLANITQLLLDTAAAKPGETILDVGCGTGTTARPLSEAVSPAGHVTAVDISTPMLEVARTRGGPINYLQADAQTHNFSPTKFDLLASRFGVMFFEDPVAAFTNLHAHLASSGRLCCITWAPLAQNPHWQIPFNIVRAHLGEPEPRHPHAPGPLAFADAAYVNYILAKSGFSRITVTPTAISIIGESLEAEARMATLFGPPGALLEEKQPSPETREKILTEITTALSPFQTGTSLSLPATVNLVTAYH